MDEIKNNASAAAADFDASMRKIEQIATSARMSDADLMEAFTRAERLYAAMPQVRSAMLKGISSLPFDFTKEDIGNFLRHPYESEMPLRQTSAGLIWTSYPYFKLIKTEQDIPTYRHYAYAEDITDEGMVGSDYLREARLIDRLIKKFRPDQRGHEAAGKALAYGKVAYVPTIETDTSHGTVNAAFWRQLPMDFCWIVGQNSESGYTVCFDMMYFTQPGTSVYDFGYGDDNVFLPYLADFEAMFLPAGYAGVNVNGKQFFPGNVRKNAQGSPKVKNANGRWMYYVTLPVEKVWVYSITDLSYNFASPLSGLALTYVQQSDFEQAQLSNVISPLLMILTGEMDYFDQAGTQKEDNYRPTIAGRAFFEHLFYEMCQRYNTSGVSWWTAPVKNIKSHTFTESANANEISQKYSIYASGKSGLAALLPVSEDIKASQVEASMKIEGRFVTSEIYPQFERMMNSIFERLRLKYRWRFKMFGTIFSEEDDREAAKDRISRGDLSGYYEDAALSGQSLLDKMSMMRTVRALGINDLLLVPPTAYTQTGDTGRPKEEGSMSDAKEKSVDAGIS